MKQARQLPNLDWYAQLQAVNMKEHFMWLAPLKISVETIANFGCWGGNEPFALLWTLDATEVVIIEKDRENLKNFEEELEKLQNLRPDAFSGRYLRTIVADMSTRINGLSSNYFDLSYCENVLYCMNKDVYALRNAIDEMARVTKIGGLIVAVEPKFGATFQQVEQDFFGTKITMPVPVSEPEDMNKFFTDAGLVKVRLEDAPDYSYCYQKRLNKEE